MQRRVEVRDGRWPLKKTIPRAGRSDAEGDATYWND